MMVPSCLRNILKATKRTEIRHKNSIFNKKGNIYSLELQSMRKCSGVDRAREETKRQCLCLGHHRESWQNTVTKVDGLSWGAKSTIPYLKQWDYHKQSVGRSALELDLTLRIVRNDRAISHGPCHIVRGMEERASVLRGAPPNLYWLGKSRS